MLKVNSFASTAPRLNNAVKTKLTPNSLKYVKNNTFDEVKIPNVEFLNSDNDKNIIAMLQDSFGFNKAKDAVTIASENMKRFWQKVQK